MEVFDVWAIIFSLTAAFAYINHKFLKVSPTIGLMVLSIAFTLVLMVLSAFTEVPGYLIKQVVIHLDFGNLLLKIMLGFLLFAGAIHVDYWELRSRILPIILLSTFGVLLSTVLIGYLAWLALPIFHFHPSILHCLIFGSLISPTDPIAVLAILKRTKISKSLRAKISGESLFNDGVSVIVFTTLLAVAAGGEAVSIPTVSIHFIREALGGLALGAGIGYFGFLLMRSINNYQVEVMLTIAFVMGGYSLASFLQVSGPLAMVVAGIITGNHILNGAVNYLSHDYLEKFWELVDEILNAVLFLLVGMELIIIKQSVWLTIAGLVIYLIVLLARFISVGLTITLLKPWQRFENGTIKIMTWGGLRGGLSIAMALSLPWAQDGELFLSLTYTSVVLSIVIQGLTIGKLARRLESKVS